jgi:hypothetical protein
MKYIYMDIDCPSENGTSLAIVCKWNKTQFGFDENSYKNIASHWFVVDKLDHIDFPEMNNTLEFYKNHCREPARLEIVKYETLPTGEMVGYIKTFWLKIIQRKWKKLMREKKLLIALRGTPKELLYREKHGKWSKHLSELPTLKGMLC